MIDTEEWPIGPMGLPYRKAARLLIIDGEEKRTLLVRGHDSHAPARSWWFTVGGGLHPGETHRQAAVRECREETGLVVSNEQLQGPVIVRRSRMYFADRERCQDEQFYLLRTQQRQLSNRSWTEQEQRLLDEMRWFNAEELRALAAQTIPIYPPELVDLISQLLESEWDGQCVKIDEYSETGKL